MKKIFIFSILFSSLVFANNFDNAGPERISGSPLIRDTIQINKKVESSDSITTIDILKSQARSEKRIADATETIALCNSIEVVTVAVGIISLLIVSNHK